MFYVWYNHRVIFEDERIGPSFEYVLYTYMKLRVEAGGRPLSMYPYLSLFPFEDESDPQPRGDCYETIVQWAIRQHGFASPRWLLASECPHFQDYAAQFAKLCSAPSPPRARMSAVHR